MQVELGRRISDELAPLDAVDARDLITHTLLEVEADLGADELEERHEKARRGRGVWVKQVGDGMSRIGAEVPDLVAQRWLLDFEEVDRAQAAVDERDGVERTAPQRRADLFAELPNRLLTLIRSMQQGESVAGASVQDRAVALLSLPVRDPVVLNLHMAATTALDLDNYPGRIEGGGPDRVLPAAGAAPDRRRATRAGRSGDGHPDRDGRPAAPTAGRARRQRQPARTTGSRLRRRPPQAQDPADPTHPTPTVGHWQGQARAAGGAVRGHGRVGKPEPQHDPSAALARLVKVRDQGCLGPGCPVPARQCHLDHRIEFGRPGGETSEANLHDLSLGCHLAKHDGWEVRRLPDGTTEWHSPLGGTYRRRPRWRPPPLFRRLPLRALPPEPEQNPGDEQDASPGGWPDEPPPF